MFIHLPDQGVVFVGDFIMPDLGAPFVTVGNLQGHSPNELLKLPVFSAFISEAAGTRRPEQKEMDRQHASSR
jgi:hypothetical protein